MDFVGRLLGFLLDACRCAGCHGPVSGYVAFCGPCAGTIERAARGSFAAFLYGGALARAIHRYKYEARDELARPLGDLFAAAVVSANLGTEPLDFVVSVPPSRAHLAARGFDAAGLLARRVASVAGIRYVPAALSRTREVPAQAGLARDARRSNVDGAFVACSRSVGGARVLVLDDVRTTGSTLRACRVALSRAGASEIVDFVLAVA